MGSILKYRGEIDPRKFLISYDVAITSADGDEVTLAKVFAYALEGPASTWYFNLQPRSIYS